MRQIITARPESTRAFLALDTTQFNATPAVSGDQLFLRSEKAVYCIGAK